MINWRTNTSVLTFLNNNKVSLAAILPSFVFFLASLLALLINYSPLPDEIPIFYSQKTQVLASKKLLFLAPAVIFLIFTVNLSLAKLFSSKWSFLSQILIITQTLVAFLILWTELKIILLF